MSSVRMYHRSSQDLDQQVPYVYHSDESLTPLSGDESSPSSSRLAEEESVKQSSSPQPEKLSLYQNDAPLGTQEISPKMAECSSGGNSNKREPANISIIDDLFQDLSQMQEHWIREAAQSTKEDQFVPDMKNTGSCNNPAERTTKRQLIQTDYGAVQIKIEDESGNEQYQASDCMLKNNDIYCKKESEDEAGGFRMPEPLLHDSGHLSPSHLNLPMLSSPRNEANYHIPSPCQIDYIENARSPIYLPQSQNEFSKRDDYFSPNSSFDGRSNSMYHSQLADIARSSSSSSSSYAPMTNRLNHDYQQQQQQQQQQQHTQMFDPIKSEMRQDERGVYTPPTNSHMKPPSNDYPVSRFDHRYKPRYHYSERFSPYNRDNCDNNNNNNSNNNNNNNNNHHNRPYHRRGTLQLWQFLVSLLAEKDCQQYIAWVGRGLEFKLIDPEEVARRWGIQKNRPAMNYDKLSRSLRYYYEKGIMQKVAGERYVYRFVCNPEALFSLAFPDGMRPLLKPQCCQLQRVTDQQLIAGTRDAYSVPTYMNSPSAFSRYSENWVKTTTESVSNNVVPTSTMSSSSSSGSGGGGGSNKH